MSSWPDVEGALRSWLRTQTPLTTALGGARIFWEAPDNPPYPCIVLTRIGGGEHPTSQVPLDNALIDLTCWGALDANGRAQWRELMTVVNTLRSTLSMVDRRTPFDADVDVFGISVAGVVRSPDPDSGRPRYVVTAEVTAITSP